MTHQLVEYGEVAGVGQESAVSVRISERCSVHTGEDTGERARRVQIRTGSTTGRPVHRSDVLIHDSTDEQQPPIEPLTHGIEWETHGESQPV